MPEYIIRCREWPDAGPDGFEGGLSPLPPPRNQKPSAAVTRDLKALVKAQMLVLMDGGESVRCDIDWD